MAAFTQVRTADNSVVDASVMLQHELQSILSAPNVVFYDDIVVGGGGGNTGNGGITRLVGAGGSAQTYTAMVNGGGADYTLSGSVDGVIQSNAVFGTTYTGSGISFELSQGGTPFVAGDQFDVTSTANPLNPDLWTRTTSQNMVFYEPSASADADVTPPFYLATRVFQQSSNTDSLEFFVGLTDEIKANSEPDESWGHNPSAQALNFQAFRKDVDLDYWVVVNKRRLVIVTNTGSFWSTMYAGLVQPLLKSNAWGPPIAYAGNRDVAYSYEDINAANRQFPLSRVGWTRLPGGRWAEINTQTTARDPIETWPFRGEGSAAMWLANQLQTEEGGEWNAVPCILRQSGGERAAYGYWEGVYAITGAGNTAGDIVSLGGVDHLLVPVTPDEAETDYFIAIALE